LQIKIADLARRITPRTEGISTSDLIKRIIQNAAALQNNKQTDGATPKNGGTPKTPEKEDSKISAPKKIDEVAVSSKSSDVDQDVKKDEEPLKPRRGRQPKK
jgi:hypothetical protein